MCRAARRVSVARAPSLRLAPPRTPELTSFPHASTFSPRPKAFLTALDTSLSRTWREEERSWRIEDREWRAQDMDFRVEERDWWHLEHLWRQENRKWRKEDIEQRVLENARWVWLRYAEKNRRDVEEKSEQLKSISNLSALIAGFAVVAFVELQFADPESKPTHVHELLIVAYAATTAIVVALMLNSMVLCSFMLCSILRNGKTYVSEDEEADYLYRCRKFALEYNPGDVPPQPVRSFERHWETRCEDDWRHAFRMFTCGVPVFLVNVACISWLKFHYSPAAAGTVTGVAIVATVGWAHTQNNWGWHIARGARKHAAHPPVSRGKHGPAGLPFDWHARPSHASGPGGFRNRRDPNEEGISDGDVTLDVISEGGEDGGRRTEDPGGRRAETAETTETTETAETAETAARASGSGGLRVNVAASPERGTRRRKASWGDVKEVVAEDGNTSGSPKPSVAERDFVRRASPRAREISERAGAAPTAMVTAEEGGEDPFSATAAALRTAHAEGGGSGR